MVAGDSGGAVLTAGGSERGREDDGTGSASEGNYALDAASVLVTGASGVRRADG
jgi:hypothetical protein